MLTVAVGCIKGFSFKITPESTQQFNRTTVLCDSELQTEGALTLMALADNESAILGTDGNSLSVDRSAHSGWWSRIRWER